MKLVFGIRFSCTYLSEKCKLIEFNPVVKKRSWFRSKSYGTIEENLHGMKDVDRDLRLLLEQLSRAERDESMIVHTKIATQFIHLVNNAGINNFSTST